MRTFFLRVVTPEGIRFEGQTESLLCRTADGDVELLAGHTDLFAPLSMGRARLRVEGKDREAFLSGGFLSMRSGEAKLCPVTFEFADEIDISRARAAKERAEAALAAAHDERTARIVRAKLSRALGRISVYEDQ